MYTKLQSLMSANIQLDNFSTAIKLAENGVYLYRGDKTFKNELTLRKTKYRVSSNTSNVYTVLLSELLPSWKDYPKRNHCVMGTTSKRKAGDYAADNNGIYHIFPKNDTVLAVCPADDLWDSFEHMGTILFRDNHISLNNFNRYFIYTLTMLIIEHNIITNNYINCDDIINYFKDSNISEIKKIFSIIENEISINMYDEYLDIICDRGNMISMLIKMLLKYLHNGIKNEHKTIITLLDEAFDPIKNGFKLIQIDQLPNIKGSHEIWFDAPYILKKIKQN